MTNKRVRVPIHRTTPTQTVEVEVGATKGAQIGLNLLLDDGTLATTAKLQTLFGATADSASSGPDTTDALDEGGYHFYFTNLRAQNAVGAILADTDTIGLAYVTGTSIAATLKDLANSTTGTLQAITVDAKGRVSGYRDATITGTDGHIAVANGNASAGLPTIDLDAAFVALIDFLQAVSPNPRVTSDNSYRVTSDGAYRVTA